jgi:membrane protease YdiL (CAAX protease family)
MSEARAPSQPDDEAVRRARRGAAVFLVTVGIVAALFAMLRVGFGGPRHPILDFSCMVVLVWTPALAAAFARVRLHEGFRDPSLALGATLKPRFLIVAIFFPLAVLLIAYGVAWSAHLAPIGMPDRAGLVEAAPALVRKLVFGLPLWLFLALGEELGWRGYLLPRLISGRVPFPLLVGGLIWSGWHLPALLWWHYPSGPSRTISAFGIVVTLTAFAFVLGRLRLDSGSVWPAALAHAIWNAALFDGLEPMTRASTYWTREGGMLVALATAAGAWWVFRGMRERAPRAFAP